MHLSVKLEFGQSRSSCLSDARLIWQYGAGSFNTRAEGAELRFGLLFFSFIFCVTFNMQATIACVLGLVTCHSFEPEQYSGQSCCFK